MKRLLSLLVVLAIVAGMGPAANAQTADTTGTITTPPVAPPPPAPPPPAPRPAASGPVAYRYAGLAGVYTIPQGDFESIAGDGWGILMTAEQFVNPTRMVAITSDAGYLDFGSKSAGATRTDFSMFPVQAGLRIYPLMQKNPDSNAQLFGEGGLGFYTTRTEVETVFGATSNYDYYFGFNAGAGVKLNANPKVSVLIDGTWNWVFATGTDPNYLALRAALMVPMSR